ncbi:MAG TPA: decarboxylase, partial [Candidatus Angelobacter sp.]|nr:decarboxylase [Candidatus Angelobacter sp.]
MSNAIRKQNVRLDQFFTVAEARHDRWRTLLAATREWEQAKLHGEGAEAKRANAVAIFTELRQWEDFFAYPGPILLNAVRERISEGDALGATRLVQAISAALLTHSYRTNAAEWEGDEVFPNSISEKLPISSDGNVAHRPYFEVLVASAARPETWPGLKDELRKLRRPQDIFVYETVFVGSFEDTILATILNGSLEAVIISEGIAFASAHDNPVLREFLTNYLAAAGVDIRSPELGLSLAQAIKLIRPELDIYLLSDREVEKVAGRLDAECLRRIFYQVEEPLELHLSILDGV